MKLGSLISPKLIRGLRLPPVLPADFKNKNEMIGKRVQFVFNFQTVITIKVQNLRGRSGYEGTMEYFYDLLIKFFVYHVIRFYLL